jgi:two-component system KDP operon response regulator KdpE
VIEKKVLIVDDEPQLQRVLRPALKASGYEVLTAATGDDALKAVAANALDLVILDLGLPDMDGKHTLRKIRVMSNLPVIVLSARDQEAEKIAALDLGADDYVEKPFSMGELLARMRAALRHAQDDAGDIARIESGGLSIDIGRRIVLKNGVVIRLTPKEFDLLAVLARHAGRLLSHREILRTVWGPAHQDDSQYLRVFVGQLRAKIEDNASAPRFILTEPGVGYRFVADGDVAE